MNYENTKCIIIIDKNLPIGMIANTAAILGCSLNHYIKDIVGSEVTDKSNIIHKGVINIPLPILEAESDKIKNIYTTCIKEYNDKLTVIGFNDVAQKCKDYDDYMKKLSHTEFDALNYFGICIYGDKKAINKMTGSLRTLK
ncbi:MULTISPECIES: DUF2000 domain-containing protein [Clostridium]|uniref:DUF2000 domain-containing protein n=1 Tax=Clostridium TaxID=1485 RepID=UPI000826C4C5|nr:MULTISPECIES: DUF2000 domain-containing protein [Clostridium]PJI08636.1 DUF2000 domain-containing protein [Clostridium sp. CT7]